MNSNKSELSKIEKSFIDMINHFEASASTSFINGMVGPNVIKNGNLKEIGKIRG